MAQEQDARQAADEMTDRQRVEEMLRAIGGFSAESRPTRLVWDLPGAITVYVNFEFDDLQTWSAYVHSRLSAPEPSHWGGSGGSVLSLQDFLTRIAGGDPTVQRTAQPE